MSNFRPEEHLTQLQGKDYLEVKWRIKWFREEHHENGSIQTEMLFYENKTAIFKAVVIVDGIIIATGTALCSDWHGGKEVMKAETAAIGRALAHAGYGTQFTDEDEDDFLADSPVQLKPNSNKLKQEETINSEWVTGFIEWCKRKNVMGDGYSENELLEALNISLATKGTMKSVMNDVDFLFTRERASCALAAWKAGYNPGNVHKILMGWGMNATEERIEIINTMIKHANIHLSDGVKF